MAHYAFIDENNIVTDVITGCDEDQLVEGVTDWEEWYGNFRGMRCLRTSYNTFMGNHNNGGTPFRKNYAGIGYSYDESRDAFIPPKIYNSWVLNEYACSWEAPVPYPQDNKFYSWNEELKQWDEGLGLAS